MRGIALSSGDTIHVGGEFEGHIDQWFPPTVDLEEWIGPELSVLWIDERWAIADFSEIERAVENGDPVVVTRAPQSLVNRIEGTSAWLTDHSLGFGAFGWDR